MSEVFSLREGQSPLVINVPHAGTDVPPVILERMTQEARRLPDTDWFVDRLYAFAADMDGTILKANYSRFVIDLNRDPGGQSLYPGQATTGLVPAELFDGAPVYEGAAPDEAEIEQRRADFFDPYHQALSEQIARVRAIHGYCVLYDAHSIASNVPRLFEDELPVLNLGTNDGQSCGSAIERAVTQVMLDQDDYETVANGRFKGGWITRTYGLPRHNIHALQMELAQRAYMDEAAIAYDEAAAAKLQPLLKDILQAALDAAEHLHWEPA
ncbi:N-formylglutamate deformylase [Hyphobacterium sp. HN65]|uniref:N-formylglutamate deformylase n=1 Tax=Hyphobacterium lacteum TaxID=3116575 RepID=A0ABU7LMF0_9PROT|nr:N-formylglutamate deformylase [Hyphobacterium sp. HN65]MEE2525079.1 N-formylglutamate deformylase [Hyphobacterium sp. HN65]